MASTTGAGIEKLANAPISPGKRNAVSKNPIRLNETRRFTHMHMRCDQGGVNGYSRISCQASVKGFFRNVAQKKFIE